MDLVRPEDRHRNVGVYPKDSLANALVPGGYSLGQWHVDSRLTAARIGIRQGGHFGAQAAVGMVRVLPMAFAERNAICASN